MNETQKLGFAIAGIKSKTWLAEQLGMGRETLLGRLTGVSSFRLDEVEKIQEIYNQLTK